MKKLLVIILGIAVLIGCKEEEDPGCNITINTSGVDQEQLAKDLDIIDAYLEENNITVVEHESGLRYIITTAGEGTNPNNCAQVLVNYKGTLLSDGSDFDANDGAVFYLSSLILGWKIGFTELRKGESATLYIPSGLGYGTSGSGDDIPANANLVFEVALIDYLNL